MAPIPSISGALTCTPNSSKCLSVTLGCRLPKNTDFDGGLRRAEAISENDLHRLLPLSRQATQAQYSLISGHAFSRPVSGLTRLNFEHSHSGTQGLGSILVWPAHPLYLNVHVRSCSTFSRLHHSIPTRLQKALTSAQGPAVKKTEPHFVKTC